jgi:sigma-B regulation protein RsbU (phosphoserine phosphatase)
LENRNLEQEVERLKSAVEELTLLNELALAASSSMEVNQMLDIIVQKSLKAVKAEQGSIMLVTAQQESPLKTLIRQEDLSDTMRSYKVGSHISGWVLKNKQPLIVENLATDSRFNVSEQESKEIRTVLCVPIIFKGQIIGVLIMVNKKSEGPFNKNDLRLLSIIAAQSGQLIRNSQLQEEAVEKKRLEHELDLAQEIQMDLLPDTDPKNDKIEVASYFAPFDAVGGDYYDYFFLENNKIALVVADVSGHGPPAALVMTMVKGILHSITRELSSADSVLTHINSIISPIVPAEVFVTMMILVLDLDKKLLQFANAGHNPLIYYDSKANVSKIVEFLGCAINIMPGIQYTTKEIALKPNDNFLVYTDGVTEAVNDEGEMFGISRLIETVQKNNDLPPQKIIEAVREDLKSFTGTTAQTDDQVLIAVKIK